MKTVRNIVVAVFAVAVPLVCVASVVIGMDIYLERLHRAEKFGFNDGQLGIPRTFCPYRDSDLRGAYFRGYAQGKK